MQAHSMHGTEEKCIENWSENLNIGDHMEDLGTDGWIMIQYQRNRMDGCELDSSGSEQTLVVGSCGQEPLAAEVTGAIFL